MHKKIQPKIEQVGYNYLCCVKRSGIFSWRASADLSIFLMLDNQLTSLCSEEPSPRHFIQLNKIRRYLFRKIR